MEQKYYKCSVCGKIIAVVKDTPVPVMCCGKKMEEIIPGTVDAAVEKHVPVYKQDGDKIYITVGEVEHPMLEEHYIEWIAVQTDAGIYRKALKPGDEPKACFALCCGEKLEAVYAYCNLHGLWKA